MLIQRDITKLEPTEDDALKGWSLYHCDMGRNRKIPINMQFINRIAL